MLRLTCLCVALLAVALPAQARMYQWVSPNSGRTQISGKPPAWYRNGESGPRVLVFENGRLVDDTAKPLSEAESAAMRAAAFSRDAAMAPAAVTVPDAEASIEETPVSPEGAEGVTGDDVAAAPPATEAPDETIARLKGIIDAWERQQTEEARRLLERSAVMSSEQETGASAPVAPPTTSSEPPLPP